MKYIKDYNSLQLYTVFIIVSCCIESTLQLVHGRYTRDIEEYELTLPHRVSSSGEFLSFSLPQYFTHKFKRWKRGVIPTEKLYYNIIFNEKDHHIELWPNHGFVSPNLVTEEYRGGTPVSSRKLERLGDELCHYVGYLKGDSRYPAALSLCHGLAGYVTTYHGQYFIEPIANHQANDNGEHVHVVYKRKPEDSPGFGGYNSGSLRCGTKERWSDAWTQQLKKAAKRAEPAETSRTSRTSHSAHRYLELLVVVDKKFIDYHKNDNMETYILTIMNMVSNYYHDSSAGNQLDVHVVRIIYLEKPDHHVDLEISKNAEVTLDSFCAWAKSVNPTDIANPQHHDIAVLLTRYDLCSDNVTDCNLMGLAFLAAACDPDKACAINEDNGLALGITVTHEVGHVMGCGHDNGEDSPCSPQNPAGEYYIMSPYVHMQTTQWSPCSKKFITELFENQLGECLNDEPQESLYQQNDMPPGSVYGADYQCNLAFPGSVHCILEESKICEMLYCKEPGSMTCNSKGDPPSDGTKCGENMWCYNTKCVEMGQRPASVDGGWGTWGPWSECSRSCGGGVSFSERACDNPQPANRGRFCIGERKQVKLCNTNDCQLGGPSFRQQQCTEFDQKPFRDQMHKWKAFYFPDKPCELNCINEINVYVALSPRAKDGTSCKPGTRNKCIFGTCRKVGCDWVLDSTAVEDMCGVCNGDGTHCTIVEKVYTDIGHGYQKLVEIPAGSRNIQVNEKSASENTIAVSTQDGKKFYLNGDFAEESNGDKDFGGVPGMYDHPSIDKETLFIRGPLPKAIILHAVFYSQDNPGFEYKYAVPSSNTSPASNGTAASKIEYVWEFLEFGECSARCGPGLKVAEAECSEKKSGKVGEKYCAKIPKPQAKTMECNIRPCKTEWRPRSWNACTGCQGKSGTHTRIIDCVRESPSAGKDPTIVEDYLCKDKTNKPATQEICCSDAPCKTVRSTDSEFEKKLAGLWNQLNAIKKRRQEHKVELNNKNYKKRGLSNAGDISWRKNAIRENHVKKYLVVPQFTRKRFDGQVSHYIKYRKLYSIGKRNVDEHCATNATPTATPTASSTAAPTTAETCETIHASVVNSTEKFVADHIAPEGNSLIEVPIKMDHENVKLSDAAFETEGDKVADTLDFCNSKIYTGKQADEEIKKLKNTVSTRK